MKEAKEQTASKKKSICLKKSYQTGHHCCELGYLNVTLLIPKCKSQHVIHCIYVIYSINVGTLLLICYFQM